MATTSSPLFSTAARGILARQLTFQGMQLGSVIKNHGHAKKPESTRQRSRRIIWQAIQFGRTYNPEYTDALFFSKIDARHPTARSAYLAYNLRRFSLGILPTAFTVDLDLDGGDSGMLITLTASGRDVAINCNDVLEYGSNRLYYRRNDDLQPILADNLIAQVQSDSRVPIDLLDINPPRGIPLHYWCKPFDLTYTKFDWIDAGTITIPD